MNEYFLVGFVVGVLLALVQPWLWAIVSNWRKKEPVTPMPVVNAPVMPMPKLPTTPVDDTPNDARTTYQWRFSDGPWGDYYYELTMLSRSGPVFLAKIVHTDKDAKGYWRTFYKDGPVEKAATDLTFEQACEWVRERTGLESPPAWHTKKR